MKKIPYTLFFDTFNLKTVKGKKIKGGKKKIKIEDKQLSIQS